MLPSFEQHFSSLSDCRRRRRRHRRYHWIIQHKPKVTKELNAAATLFYAHGIGMAFSVHFCSANRHVPTEGERKVLWTFLVPSILSIRLRYMKAYEQKSWQAFSPSCKAFPIEMTPILLLLCWRGNATKKKKIQQFTQLHLERACGVGLCRLRTYVFWPEMSSLKKEDSIFPIRRHAAPSAFHRIAHTFSLLNKLTSRLKKKKKSVPAHSLCTSVRPPSFLFVFHTYSSQYLLLSTSH